MSDIIQVADLEKTKFHNTFHVEAVTGKVGGLAGGADIDYTTNAVTGQVQKTLPKILADIDWSYVGLFADGVTFTKSTDFAVDESGIQWIYTGTYPFTTETATVPSEPLYQVVHVGSLQDLTGLTEPSDLAQRHRIKTTVAEIATGVFKVGDRLEVTDRNNAPFNMVAGGVPDGFGTLNAGVSKTAVIDGSNELNQSHFGVTGVGYPTDEGPGLNAYADYCRLTNRVLNLNDLNGLVIIYTTKTINFEGLDVTGSRAGIYDFGSLPHDGLGYGLLTGIPSGRPSVASVYNDTLRKPPAGVCILSDIATEIVKVDARRFHGGYGVTGWLETVGQHGIVNVFDAAYKGVSFNWGDIYVSGCGSDGVVLPNGIELSTWENVRLFYNNGYGLTTAGGGGDDNQEYSVFKSCKFYMNRLDGVLISGFRKGIEFDNCGGNSNGWYGLGATYSVGKPADESNIRGMVRVEGNTSGSSLLSFKNCFSEDCARLVTLLLTNPLRVVRVEDNYIIPSLSLADTNNDVLFTEDISGTGLGQIRDLVIRGNSTQNGTRGLIWRNEVPTTQLIDVEIDRYQTTNVTLSELSIDRVVKEVNREELTLKKHVSAGFAAIGDGTAGTFTSNFIKDSLRTTGTGNNTHSRGTAYLVTTNWASTNSTAGGAYLVFAMMQPSGNIFGGAQVIGAGGGFTSAPTVSADGTLSVPIANFYRASVTRIDLNGYKV